MSIETAAKDLACELMRQEYVEVLCHHDADGIAAGLLLAKFLGTFCGKSNDSFFYIGLDGEWMVECAGSGDTFFILHLVEQ